MKKYSFLLVFLFSCATYSQVTIEEPYIEVFSNLENNKDQLYIKVNDWMVSTFTSSESVIEFTDKENGVVIGKYLMHGDLHHGGYGVKVDSRVYAKINVRVKDNKVRIEIEPLGSWNYDKMGMTVYNYSKEDALADMEKLATSLFESLKKENIEF